MKALQRGELHTAEELAPLMLRYLLALNAAARARRLACKHSSHSRQVKALRMERRAA